ncbi:LOW QUALITY PROTEIN: TRAPP III complex, Trs85, partial [Dillenia turbinata]
MDMTTTILGKMLLEQITPVVMVLCTSHVEEMCQKNRLSFVQMLQPVAVFNNFDVLYGLRPYRLRKFNMWLFYVSDIHQPDLEAKKKCLKQVIQQAGEKDFSDSATDPPLIENVLNSPQSEILPSWFQFFNDELVRTFSFSDHEAFDHPVACLLVVSSEEEEPINKFVDLFNTNRLPSLINDGAMDPKILKHYLLVHDNQDHTTEKTAKILTEMRGTFGSNDCSLLCINSSEDGSEEHKDILWASTGNDSDSDHLGSFLNIDDINEIRGLMQDLSIKHIIPYMEQKIRILNHQVSAMRKGFRNQIKNLWWRKGKEDASDAPNGPMYNFSSIESQIRVLGDYAFMLQDYELALSNYRLLSTDYKLDKAWKRYAGVQEMMGLTYFMLDQSRKEAENCMENACSTYLKGGSSGHRNATRCGIWWAEMLKAREQYTDAAGIYFRVSGEDALHSAVMLEQASYCYLFSKPPMLRKYGFHLVLSGDYYKRSDQIKHAIRTYRSALSVYKASAWSRIKDRVYFDTARWYAVLGIFDVAVQHMLEVLACSHQSKSIQELFLSDFLQLVQRTGKSFDISRLQLPVINTASLKIIFEDQRTYASPTAVAIKESLWCSLEEDLVPSLSTLRTNWLESHAKSISKKDKELTVCVAGEAIKVDVEFKNPLQIPISISNVSLICDLAARSDEIASDEHGSTTELQNDEEVTDLVTNREQGSNSSFTLSEGDFSIGGGETILVQLTVTPKVEGILNIIGVRWKFLGAVLGVYKFEPKVVKSRVAKRRKSKRSLNDNLKLLVTKSAPKLDGLIRHFPRMLYAGELCHLVLELRNQSEFRLKNLKMKISHPRFLSVGSREDLDISFPRCLEKTINFEESSLKTEFDGRSKTIFMFPEDVHVQGDTPFLWPIWLRAAVPGNISLYITIYYEIEDVSSLMRYRTLCMCYNLEVLPSLDVSFQISPTPSKLQEFLVRMDIVNRTTSGDFQVHQLSLIGNQWELSLLQPADKLYPLQSLRAGQAMSCFFRLKNVMKSFALEQTPSLASIHQTEVRLSPQLDNGALYDILKSPLADFHHQERLLQESPQKGDPDTVDFILISQLLENDADVGISNSPQFTASMSPIWWLVDGPKTLQHDFSTSFCEIYLHMTLYNSSSSVISTRIVTNDYASNSSQSNDTNSVSLGSQAGWYDVPQMNEIKGTSNVLGIQVGKLKSLDSVMPFMWSGTSSTRVELEPMRTVEVPLQLCIFAPGTYDLSNYCLHWSYPVSDDLDTAMADSGTCRGHPTCYKLSSNTTLPASKVIELILVLGTIRDRYRLIHNSSSGVFTGY